MESDRTEYQNTAVQWSHSQCSHHLPVDLSHPAPAHSLEDEERAELLAGYDGVLAGPEHGAGGHHSVTAGSPELTEGENMTS